MGSAGSKGDKLTKEDIAYLVANTKYNETAILEWYSGFLSDCPDGRLNKDRFLRMYEMFFTKGDPDEFCSHVFRTFDTDGNGFIDFKEFLISVCATANGTPNEKLRWAFRMYDIDGDGGIQREEMYKIIKALYAMLGTDEKELEDPQDKTRRIFKKMDTNEDGIISSEEFLEGCTADPQLAQLLTNNVPATG